MSRATKKYVLEQFDSISFAVPGEPVPMPRARHSRAGNFVRTYTPAHATAHKGLVALAWRQALRSTGPHGIYSYNPVSLDIVVIRTLPAAAQKWKHAMVDENMAVHAGPDDGWLLPVTVQGDWDNYGKLVSDALNGLAYHDDAQVFDGRVRKQYGGTAETRITVTYWRWVPREE